MEIPIYKGTYMYQFIEGLEIYCFKEIKGQYIRDHWEIKSQQKVTRIIKYPTSNFSLNDWIN